jgi:hypothetical protein
MFSSKNKIYLNKPVLTVFIVNSNKQQSKQSETIFGLKKLLHKPFSNFLIHNWLPV